MLPLGAFAQLPTPTYGWNLGNTLEPPCGEGCWGPPATQALINGVANAGFNAIRIPCAWDSHANQSTYQIDPAFMARVQQVVDWCIARNLYVIINDHWDDGWLENNITGTVDPTINAKMNSYWTQIANAFATYDNRLLFAGANEPNVDTAAQMSTLITYYNTFISAVRSTGGNNTSRWLVVQGPNTDIDTTYNLMNTMPTDSTSGRLMVEIHYYSPWNLCGLTSDQSWGNQFFYWGQGYHSTTDTAHNPTWGEEAYVDAEFQKMTAKFVNVGIPVMLGETEAMKRTTLTGANLSLHLASRTYFHKYVADSARGHGIKPFYWDTPGPGQAFDWTTGTVYDPDNVTALTGGPALPPPGSGPPPALTGLTATVASSNQINLSWAASSGADSYIVKRSTTSGSGYTTIASGVTATSYLDAGLVNGTTYYYVVAATNAYGISADSAEVGATLTDIRALYAFEGSAQDSSGNGNHGTANALSYVAGKVGTQAAQFNGKSSYVLIPRSIENDFTVAMWLKTTDTAGSAGAQWWSGKGLVDGEVAGGGADWGTAIVSGTFALGVGSSGGDTNIASSVNINDGTWHHVAATRNNTSGAMQVYVDGVLRGSGTGPTGSRTFPPSLRIGSLQTANNYLNGTLDDVRLYNRVLTAGEIAALIGTPPAAPTGLTAIAGSGSVALSWSASATATNYYVKRSTTSGTGYTTIATNASLAFTDIGLNSSTIYYYVVSAVSASGESTNSSEVSATPLSEFQSWQLTYFGSTNCASCAGGADFDGDGVSNTNEFLAGTDPTDSASAFRILSIISTGNDVVVTWQAGVDKTNALQAGTLTNYTDVSGPIAITVTPTNATEFGGATNAGPWFYRIRLIP
jgi:hypothetical protein